ncbi:uncharacterized protein LOC108856421 [Raphanus sativus]|uniref:Uncharacterized protein LOC108856421 n=1 Tax=Raphanus sativus TaxID=3726 RepID=A0A6J0NNK6_RAPSA|nr:uncharacterized protein LOC108856421 [Raphanus sativus]XP_018485712.1 uncharacterized protein LOC108856421 [Raphanus sativus]XP_018485713.1 uncharacterized protein LOC108856421 [Raphanus sativus]XP_018485714.1 uncharacterized protein LOC108856421 [Raphanus sativus]
MILCIVNLINYMDRGVIASNGVNGSSTPCDFIGLCSAGTGIQGEFRLSNFQDGLLSSAFMVGLLVASPIFAALSKRPSVNLLYLSQSLFLCIKKLNQRSNVSMFLYIGCFSLGPAIIISEGAPKIWIVCFSDLHGGFVRILGSNTTNSIGSLLPSHEVLFFCYGFLIKVEMRGSLCKVCSCVFSSSV